MRKKQIFLSHAWGIDEYGRNNHNRVKELGNKLSNYGYNVWFDDNDMIGNIDKSIIDGINECDIIIFCLTTKYCNKINFALNNNIPNDNCYKEWNYTLFCKKKFIVIIMEGSMHKTFLNNQSILQLYLNNILYIDFSINLYDNFNKLLKTLQYYQIFPYINNKFYYNKKRFYKLIKSNKLNPVLFHKSSRRTVIKV